MSSKLTTWYNAVTVRPSTVPSRRLVCTERHCADTIGTVPVPCAPAISNAKTWIHISNKIYGSYFIKQHSETKGTVLWGRGCPGCDTIRAAILACAQSRLNLLHGLGNPATVGVVRWSSAGDTVLVNSALHPPGLLDRVPASAGVRAGISPLSGGR